MLIEIRVPDESDQDPHAPYRWVWGGDMCDAIGSPHGEFVGTGTKRYSFEVKDGGHVDIELRNTHPPQIARAPQLLARIQIDVDERSGIADG